MKPLLVRMLAGLMISGSSAAAQAPDCGQTIQALERVVAAQKRLLNDWGGLTRYGSENTEIRPPAPGEERVVFLGDQITELWGRGTRSSFPESRISIGASAGKPRPRCWCVSTRM